MADGVYIYQAIRAPRAKAKPSGALHQLHPYEILKQLYTALIDRTKLQPELVDDVLLGCVTQSGEQAGNIARASLNYSGWPSHVPGLTINRFCSSSLDATAYAADRIAAGRASMVISGGIESMSRVPMLSDQAQWMLDLALTETMNTFPLGVGADIVASLAGYSRDQLDSYALQSQQRAAKAQSQRRFEQSIVAIQCPDGTVADRDQAIRADMSMSQLADLPSAFEQMSAGDLDQRALASFAELTQIDHQHTAGNSPAMVDGGSLLLLANAQAGETLAVPARAKIIDHCSLCGPSTEVLTGGTASAQQLLKRNKLRAADLDVVEFNESFAGPTIKFIEDLRLDPTKVNVNGGAISLGHPMGATGSNLLSMLIDELHRSDQQLGMVSICGATGSGSAMLIERCD